jgi:hypothetical protein
MKFGEQGNSSRKGMTLRVLTMFDIVDQELTIYD